MSYKFGNICERDIDVLLLNSFAQDKAFINLFVSKISNHIFNNPRVTDIELSKVHLTWGESDVTVIFESDEVKYALLIEDKVGAQAQPEQCMRYFKRGDIGIDNKEYTEYYVFVCASEEYIKTNSEACKYPYCVTFEELAEYFKSKNDLFGKVRYEEIQQAMEFAKTPYKKIVDSVATEFWNDYVKYVQHYYPDLQLLNGSKEKSRSGDWPVYYTQLNYNKKVYIQHKMDRGIVDLTFNGMANRQNELRKFLIEHIGNYEEAGFGIRPAGKSAVLRCDLGTDNALSFQKRFDLQIDVAKMHFEAIYKLHLIAASLNCDDVERLIQGGNEK